MTTMMAPVELPTGRRSYLNTAPLPDIHDPNWIPVLGGEYKPPSPSVEKELSPYQNASFPPPASFSLFPGQASSPKPRQGVSHNYSKSSLAPESVASESRSQSPEETIEPVPPISEAIKNAHPERAGHVRRPTSMGGASVEEKISVRTETPGDMVPSAASTDGTSSSVVEEQTTSSNPETGSEEAMISPSSRSSMTSTRKGPVFPPTSKYNRKPVVSMAASIGTTGRPPFIPSLPQTPAESPRLGPSVPIMPAANPMSQLPPSPKLIPLEPPAQAPTQSFPQPPPEPESTTPKLGPMKSSASERRQRALHSHPSNLSLRSRRNSSSDDAEITPKPPSVRHKPRKSTDSRPTTPRSTIYDSQTPTPAPTAPLPQLPPQARRPSTHISEARRSPQLPSAENPMPSMHSFKPSQHSELAAFMTSENTVVFRRFDDVHVQLLLCLQDEITQLERELQELDNSNGPGTASEKILKRSRILRELRKVVAEYGEQIATPNVLLWLY